MTVLIAVLLFKLHHKYGLHRVLHWRFVIPAHSVGQPSSRWERLRLLPSSLDKAITFQVRRLWLSRPIQHGRFCVPKHFGVGDLTLPRNVHDVRQADDTLHGEMKH